MTYAPYMLIVIALALVAGCINPDVALRKERDRQFAGKVADAIRTRKNVQDALQDVLPVAWYVEAGEWAIANPVAAGGFLSGVVALVAGGEAGRRKWVAAMIERRAKA